MSADEKRFPILGHEWIKSVPWSVVEPHREQAQRNHDQTLERLAERGGLGIEELTAILADQHWNMFEQRKKGMRP